MAPDDDCSTSTMMTRMMLLMLTTMIYGRQLQVTLCSLAASVGKIRMND